MARRSSSRLRWRNFEKSRRSPTRWLKRWPLAATSAKFSLAGGLFAATAVGDSDSEHGGLLYSAATFGGPQRAATLGVGLGYENGDLGADPAFFFGVEQQLGDKLKLISENYLFTDSSDRFYLFSAGLRFFGRRLAADFAFFTFPQLLDEGMGFPFIPWIGFSYNFAP